MFYEIEVETGKKTWEAGGVFAPTDVHRQVLFSYGISEYNLMARLYYSIQVFTIDWNSQAIHWMYMDQFLRFLGH